MFEIPPANDTDAEDVAWGLQTADTLWKRGERIDALVWLRRAAQAAGDANDDDRALELARSAAELTDAMAELGEDASVEITASMSAHPGPDASGSTTPPRMPAGTQPMIEAAPPVAPEPPRSEDEGRPSATSVPPAEKVHAGMFDPWSDRPSQTSQPAVRPPPRVPVPVIPVPRIEVEEDEGEEIVTSVRPAATPQAPVSDPPVALPKPTLPVSPPQTAPAANTSGKPPVPMPPRPPPPLPARARPPVPKPAPPPVVEADAAVELLSIPPESEVVELVSIPPSAAAPIAVESLPPPAVAPIAVESVAPASAAAIAVESIAPPAVAPAAAIAVESIAPPAVAPIAVESVAPAADAAVEALPAKLDLDSVDAFSDLPDDARSDFASAAQIHALAEGEEIGTFALAYIVAGAFDVAATMVDAPAIRLAAGAVLRSRGTTEENVPIRLISANGSGVVATWSDASVEEAFRTCPWVEEDLRAAADRVQTVVGVTIGPLGERLDVSIREEIISRLALRPLAPSEMVVQAGEPVPGLLLVGIGELELFKDDAVTGVVGSGEFLFPTEVMGNGFAPVSVRAGAGGALVLFGDRRIAQELLVTCPPLLEVFAGM